MNNDGDLLVWSPRYRTFYILIALHLIRKPTNEREKVEDFFDNANEIRYGTFRGSSWQNSGMTKF